MPARYSATTITAAPTLRPMIRPLRRRAAPQGLRAGRCGHWPPWRAPGSSTGSMCSVRSAIAVACCSRFSRVGALRIPPPAWTARRPPPRSGTGSRDRPTRGSTGSPAESTLGRLQPAAHARLGQRPPVDQQRVQRRTDAADVVFGVGVGHCRRERQRHVAFDAHPDPAGVVDRQRHPRRDGPPRPRRPATASRGRRRSATATCRPLPAATRRGSIREPPGRREPVFATSSTRAMPGSLSG